MNADYVDLKHLQTVRGYQKLEQIWIQQVSKIEESRDKTAQRNSESSWRYAAGKEAGFKLAMTALQRAILDIEAKEQDLTEQTEVDKLMEELKIKGESRP